MPRNDVIDKFFDKYIGAAGVSFEFFPQPCNLTVDIYATSLRFSAPSDNPNLQYSIEPGIGISLNMWQRYTNITPYLSLFFQKIEHLTPIPSNNILSTRYGNFFEITSKAMWGGHLEIGYAFNAYINLVGKYTWDNYHKSQFSLSIHTQYLPLQLPITQPVKRYLPYIHIRLNSISS